jgi:hypothetical protein
LPFNSHSDVAQQQDESDRDSNKSGADEIESGSSKVVDIDRNRNGMDCSNDSGGGTIGTRQDPAAADWLAGLPTRGISA